MFTQPEKEYIQRLFKAQPSLTNDDVRKLIDQRRQKEITMNTPKQKGILGKIGGGLMNIGAGAIQAGGELAVGLPGQLSRLAPGDQSANQSSFYNKTQRLLEDTKKQQTEQGRDTEGLGFGFGKGVMNIAAGSVGAGLLGKGAQALANTGTATNLGTQIATKSPTLAKYGGEVIKGFTGGASKGNLAQKVIGGAATGLREGLGFDLASANTPGAGTVGGAVIGGALPIVGAGLKATGNYLSRTLPGNLQLQGLMNPAKVTMLKKQLQTEGVTSPQDVGKWMLDRGIKGNKETIINTLISRAEKSKQAVDDSLSAIKKTVFSPVAKKALQQTYDDMAKVAGLEDDAAKVLKLLKKDKYTLSELNGVKRILDDQYNLFTKTGDPTAGLKAKGLQTIRQQLRKTIEEVASEAGVKNIRALNNETQIARTMADAIARKDSADAVREALTAFAPTGVGGIIGGVAGPFDNSTIEGKVGNVLLGMLAGKVLGSTTLKTNIASLLNKLSKQEIGALDAYLRSGGKTALTPKIIQTMDDTLKLLPPASGKPVSASVVDVKPMTGFSPGRTQAQQQAIGSKVGIQPLTTATQQNPGVSGVTPLSSTQGVQQKILPKVPGEKVIPPIIPKTEVKAKLRTNEDALKKANSILPGNNTRTLYELANENPAKLKRMLMEDPSIGSMKADALIERAKLGKVRDDVAGNILKPETKLPKTPQEGKTIDSKKLLEKFTGRDSAETNLRNLEKASPEGWKIDSMKIDDIQHNIRADDFENLKESQGKIDGIIEKYKKDGIVQPIIVNKNGQVLDGNHRINAYKMLGLKEVPVYSPILADLSKADNLATRLKAGGETLDSYFTDKVTDKPKSSLPPPQEGKTGVKVVKTQQPTEFKIVEDKGLYNLMQKNPTTGKWELSLGNFAQPEEAAKFVPKSATLLEEPKPSLPLSQKSEVKYSKPENTELLDFMKKQKVINESSSIWQGKAKKIAEEYPDGFGGISNEGRALPETKEVLKNLEYYTKMLKDFNSSKTSKEFIKKLGKMNIVERMALRKSLK